MEAQDLLFVYDTETSGEPNWKQPSEGPDQPHITEIAALLFTRQGELVDSFHAFVKPDGWTIAPEAAAVNGHTVEFLTECGIPEAEALAGALALHDRCSGRVAHNRNFDDRIMRIALKRLRGDEAADAFKAVGGECTAMLMRPICQLPPTEAMMKTRFKNTFKTPTLSEAYRHQFGLELVDAHGAWADAMATAAVYFKLQGITLPPSDALQTRAVATVETEVAP